MVRIALAAAFLAAELVLMVVADPDAEDEPWGSILVLAVPLVFGLAIDRWWPLALVPVVPLAAYVDDPNVFDHFVPWFGVLATSVVIAVPYMLGIGVRRIVRRVRA